MRIGKIIKKIIGTLLKLVIVAGLLTILAFGVHFYTLYGKTILQLKNQAAQIAQSSRREDFMEALTTAVYDSNGELISTLRSGKDSYYLLYDELPSYAIDIMLVTEDKKFYSHRGVDLVANIRAAKELIEHDGKITQGASTITQQLARTIYLTYDVTYERKIKEIFLAWELEKKYSKHDILEFYMNNIYFANSFYGIQAAAQGYFGKGAQELTLSQMAFLCAIPNSPDVYNPYLHFDNTVKRRDRMLKQMYEDEKITQEQYAQALSEEIVLKKQESVRHDYVETYAYYCAIRALMERSGFRFQTVFSSEEEKKEYEERYQAGYQYWQKKLYTGGYRVYTSINLEQQELLQKAVDEETKEYEEKNAEGVYELQASAVCIDNQTGRVTAIVGGRQQEFAGYTLNRAYQSFRQPGSSIKPLIIYAPLFERGLSPDDIVLDKKFEGGPLNSGGSYLGEITVRKAVESSKNTVAWKLFAELTPQVGLGYLQRMNFRKIVSSDFFPAAALGGLTYGASALEMTSAYATLAYDGIYRTPTCIVKITDNTGKIVVENPGEKLRIYEENAAHVMTDVLRGVMTRGTAKKYNLSNAIAAGKTGTTNYKRDGWFIGYTAFYTTGVWVGCDRPKTVDSLSGNTYPLAIWNNFMEEIHEGLEKVDFPEFRPITQTRFSEKEVEEEPIEEFDELGPNEFGEVYLPIKPLESLVPGWAEDTNPF